MKKILVVIDMQNDFIDGPLGTPEARAIVPRVCEKIREGEWYKIIRTMDTHSPLYLGTQEGQKLPIEHCMLDTDGWKLNEDIHDTILDTCAKIADENGYCSYESALKSGFGYRAWNKNCSGLIPSQMEIHIVGVCTDICVITNALVLKTHFPEARIVVDASCCAGTTPEMHEMALRVMESCQIDIVGED